MNHITRNTLLFASLAGMVSCNNSSKNTSSSESSGEANTSESATKQNTSSALQTKTVNGVTLIDTSVLSKPITPGISKIDNYSKIDADIRAIEKLYSQTGSLKSTVSAKMAAGQNGYLIATNEEFVKKSKELQNFIKHKESLGFKVHVATEKDWGISDKGKGKGRHQADLVHKWMKENYKKLNLLYTLIIENPHPDEGMIPMAKFKPRRYKVPTPEEKRDYAKYLKYKDNPRTEDGKFLLFDGSDPSDYYYADLTSDWDANNNSILHDKGDVTSGKIDGTAEVYVGRIPLYGGEHPYSQIADADDMLRRTIDYENAKGDLSWRNNLFYVGGADKRYKAMQDHFLRYTGGTQTTCRVSSGYGYEPTYTKWHGGKCATILNKNKVGFGFTNFQEHGSWNSMAGQISNKAANELSTDYPSYVYLGGCDVASPEHGENVTYTLFRRIGIAAMGATRSVTGLGGDKDTHSAAAYERLYFGQSTGEAHWGTLSGLADGMKKVGASNFLMNLMGDPSVVVMPQLTSSPIVVAPRMKVLKFNHQHRSKNPIGYDFTIRNNSNEKRSYKLQSPKLLAFSANDFELAPFEKKTVSITFANPETIPVGLNETYFDVISGDNYETQKMALNVYARTTAFYAGFNTFDERKFVAFAAKGPKVEELKKFTEEHKADDYVTIPKGNRADLAKTKFVPGETDVTIAVKFKYDGKPKGLTEWIRLGKTFDCFLLNAENGKLAIRFNSLLGFEEESTQGIVEFDLPEAGKWHTLVTSVDRNAKKITAIVNGEKKSAPFAVKSGQGLAFDRIRLGYSRNKVDVALDEFSIFDYVLTDGEVQRVLAGDVIKQKFPRNNDLANPAGVNLGWKYANDAKDQTFVVAYSTKPDFSDMKEIETKDSAAVVDGLSDKTTYFWKVGLKENGNIVYPWDSFSTFTTDSTLENPNIVISKRGIPQAPLKDNGYRIDLNKFCKAMSKPDSRGKQKRLPLTFAKVSGPSWLRVHPDGACTTNFGADKLGKHEFEFSVSTQYGLPVKFKKTITVK